MSDWFYFKGEQRIGPVGPKQLKDLAATGKIQPTDQVWKEGMATPLPAAKLKGLFEATPSTRPPTVASTPTSPLAAHGSPSKSNEAHRPKSSIESGRSPNSRTSSVASKPGTAAEEDSETDARQRRSSMDKANKKNWLTAKWSRLNGKQKIGVIVGGVLVMGLIGSGMERKTTADKTEIAGVVPSYDFSKVDYSVDFSNVDYSIPDVNFAKGPDRQVLIRREGARDEEQRERPVTEEGYTDRNGKFVRHGIRTLWYELEIGKLEGKRKFGEDTWYLGKRHGKMLSWDKKGQKRLERYYLDGQLHGKSTSWHEDGQLKAEIYWAKGKEHGSWKEWHKNGQLSREGVCKDGQQHGKWASWHENGNRKEEEYYIRNNFHGSVVAWHDNGQKKLETAFVEGKENGLHVEWHSNGQKLREYICKDGLRQGTFTEWHQNNQKANEGIYKDGKEEGKWVRWHPDGSKANEGMFSNGKQIGVQTDWYNNGDVRVLSTFVDGAKMKEVSFYPADVRGPGGRPIGPGHIWHEYSWIVLPGASRPVPNGTWKDYNPDGSLNKIERFNNGLPN